jgi:hypothetical protein
MKMKTIPLVAVLVISVFAAGCIISQPTCNEPYILVGDTCCLDQNGNGICDADETPAAPEEPEAAPEEEPEPVENESVSELPPTTPECTHNTDCDDNNECTTDGCVGGECRHTTVPNCVQPAPGAVTTPYISYVHCDENDGEWEDQYLNNNEWVQIKGTGVQLTGYSLEDSNGIKFDFPDKFDLRGVLYVHAGYGIKTDIDLYVGQRDPIWEPGVTVYLKSPSGAVLDQSGCDDQ